MVGYDVLGGVITEDLSQCPHLLLGGSTNSGKSVGLQSLITSIAYTKSPSQANFVLIDVGGKDLLVFEKLPHLSHPVVQDRATAIRVLAALTAEMERRIELKRIQVPPFQRLSRLVVVIDEFPALFTGIDKTEAQMLIANISNLLQRGRHAQIHLVLAAQNPTFHNMKIDLGNITARIAFKCAKKNFSEVILGESGAEKLLGRGDMLLKTPAHDLRRIQGSYATEGEFAKLTKQISWRYASEKNMVFSLKIPDDDLTGSAQIWGKNLSCSVVRKRPSEEDRLLASVIMWTLEHDSISANMLMATFHLGWNKAAKLIQRLEKLGIVDRLEGKLPREVIPDSPRDIPAELMEFLEANGYSESDILVAFYSEINHLCKGLFPFSASYY